MQMTMELKITCFAIQSAFRERKRVWVNVLVGHPRVRPLDLGFSVHGSSFKTLLSIHRSCHMTSFTRSRCTSNRGWGNLYVYSLSLSLLASYCYLGQLGSMIHFFSSGGDASLLRTWMKKAATRTFQARFFF